MQWFLFKQGQQEGPYDLAQLQALAGQGYIQAEDMLWQPGMTQYVSVQHMPELWQIPQAPTDIYYAPFNEAQASPEEIPSTIESLYSAPETTSELIQEYITTEEEAQQERYTPTDTPTDISEPPIDSPTAPVETIEPIISSEALEIPSPEPSSLPIAEIPIPEPSTPMVAETAPIETAPQNTELKTPTTNFAISLADPFPELDAPSSTSIITDAPSRPFGLRKIAPNITLPKREKRVKDKPVKLLKEKKLRRAKEPKNSNSEHPKRNKKRIIVIALALLLAGLVATIGAWLAGMFDAQAPAQITTNPDGSSLDINGPLGAGTAEAAEAVIKQNADIFIIRLSSREGSMEEARHLRDLFKARGLTTIVSTQCFNACVIAFSGGAERLITANAQLGAQPDGFPLLWLRDLHDVYADDKQAFIQNGIQAALFESMMSTAASSPWMPDHKTLMDAKLVTGYAADGF